MTPTFSATLLQFLTHLHRGGAWGYWWCTDGKYKATYWWPAGRPAPYPNGKAPVNIYFGVHPTARAGTQAQRAWAEPKPGEPQPSPEVVAINCLFAEFDAHDFLGGKPAARAHLDAIQPPASVIIDSGGGWHAYWLLAEPLLLTSPAERERAKAAQYAWVAHTHGDPDAKDLARVLRVPGTRNWKPQYAPDFPTVDFAFVDFTRLYTLDILETAAEPIPSPASAFCERGRVREGAARERAYAQVALQRELAALSQAQPGHRNAHLNRSAFALGQLVASGWLDRALVEAELERVAFDLGLVADDGERQVRATIRSGLDAGAREPRTRLEPPPASQADERLDREVGRPADTPAAAVVLRFPCTDTGNAELVAHLYGDRLRYDHKHERWLLWSGERWLRDTTNVMQRLAIRAARLRLRTAAEIEDADLRSRAVRWALSSEQLWRMRATVEVLSGLQPVADDGEHWDADSMLVGCPNGVVDLRTGALRPARPEDRVTLCTGIAFDRGARAPRWEQFLAEVFERHPEIIPFLRRAAGYSLTGSTAEQKFFLCWGEGANGKGTLFEMLRQAFGDYAANTPFSTFEMSSATQTNDLAALAGKRLVTASETTEARRLNEARVKAVTGGDPVTCRFLNKEFFTYTPSFHVWLAVNHMPIVTDTSRGMWRRVLLIPFEVTFEGREDKGLLDTLRGELPGILAWAVRGALEWQREGLQPPQAVLAATRAYREESDELGRFLETCTILRADTVTRAGDLRKAYEAWCGRSGLEAISPQRFSQQMRQRPGINRDEDNRGVFYEGVGLVEPPASPMD